MIGQKLRPVSRKMWQFHLNINIEGTLWRHTVTLSTSKIFGGGLILDGISIFNVKMNLYEILRNFQNGRHFEVRRTFKPEIAPEVDDVINIGLEEYQSSKDMVVR